MTKKTVSGLAFAAGCALALGAMPSAQAQTAIGAVNSTLSTQPPYAGATIGSAETVASAAPPSAQGQTAIGAANSTLSTQPPYAGATIGSAAPASYRVDPHPAAAPPQVVADRPQASRGDLGHWSARQNVIESRRYDRLLQTNMAFRRSRMRKECGPIGNPQLHRECLASFQKYEPVMVGSSAPPSWHDAGHHQAATYREERYGAGSGGSGGVGSALPGHTPGASKAPQTKVYNNNQTQGSGGSVTPAPNPAPALPGQTPGASNAPQTKVYNNNNNQTQGSGGSITAAPSPAPALPGHTPGASGAPQTGVYKNR